MTEAGARLFEELMRFRPEGMSANAWAVKAGVSRTIWADLKRHGNPSRRTLSKLLEAAGSSLAEFEALRIGRAPPASAPALHLAEATQGWGRAHLTPLPVVWTAGGGRWGGTIELIAVDFEQVIDRLPRPPSLAADRDAYAVTVTGESMWPRFRPGRRIAVSPTSPVEIGDDLLVILAGNLEALIGELRFRTAEAVGLRHFNPQAEFEVLLTDVAAVHKVLGEMI